MTFLYKKGIKRTNDYKIHLSGTSVLKQSCYPGTHMIKKNFPYALHMDSEIS